jgi:hypothetical protein
MRRMSKMSNPIFGRFQPVPKWVLLEAGGCRLVARIHTLLLLWTSLYCQPMGLE